MNWLPDVNVWLALWVERHYHHQPAREWFAEVEADSAAFCRVTQLGFLRLLTNPCVMEEDVLNQRRAWLLMDLVRRDERVCFATEPPGVEKVWREYCSGTAVSHRQWTDGYLLAVASVSRMGLVTFDKALARTAGRPAVLLR